MLPRDTAWNAPTRVAARSVPFTITGALVGNVIASYRGYPPTRYTVLYGSNALAASALGFALFEVIDQHAENRRGAGAFAGGATFGLWGRFTSGLRLSTHAMIVYRNIAIGSVCGFALVVADEQLELLKDDWVEVELERRRKL